MAVDRRTFLKISALAALGAASGKPLLAALGNVKPDQIAPPGAPLATDRWAMAIDIQKCLESDVLDRCVRACNAVHNVPDIRDKDGQVSLKHEIKWIWQEPYHRVFPSKHNEHQAHDLPHKKVLTLCNHCSNPPCVRVCPTQATFKRPDGIVAQDQHRCIGCRFCIAACPYGSRSFNWIDPRPHIEKIDPNYPTRAKGVVEKCTFCAERLAVGKPPACVEAAGNTGALVFGNLKDEHSAIRQILENHFTIRRKPELGTDPAVYYVVS